MISHSAFALYTIWRKEHKIELYAINIHAESL
jgi:hypothetical protein